jgi:hypothetical protein
MDNRGAPSIFVTGASRSGTSMTAGLIAHHGAWCGPSLEADAKNPRGYFESLALKQQMRDPQPEWPERLVAYMAEHGYGGGPAVFKMGPDAWHLVQHLDPVVVFCWRPVADIAASRARVGWDSTERAILTAWDRMRRIRKEARQVVDVHTDELVRDPAGIAPALEAVGLAYRPDVAAGFVEPDLWSGSGG